MNDQKTLIDDLTSEDEWWLVLIDAARYDYVADRYYRYLDGDLKKADNSGVGFTATWFKRMLPGMYEGVCFNPQPIFTFQGNTDYDERDHFRSVPSQNDYEWDTELGSVPPRNVVDVVEEYRDGFMADRLEALGYVDHAEQAEGLTQRGIIRFLQPHAPFRELPELTRARANRAGKLAQAVRSGNISKEDIHDAYADNLRWVLRALEGFVEELPGRVVVTSDHGELLGEDGKYLHTDAWGDHEKIRTVPWIEVEQ